MQITFHIIFYITLFKCSFMILPMQYILQIKVKLKYHVTKSP